MSEVRIVRMSTGEDIIASVERGADIVTLKKPFVIIPMQPQPGKPVQLMMTPYMPYSADANVEISKDKVVTIVKPKDDILKSYQANISQIITPNKELITETKLPKI